MTPFSIRSTRPSASSVSPPVAAVALLGALLGAMVAADARADVPQDAEAFLRKEQAQLVDIVKKGGKDEDLNAQLDTFVNYRAVAESAFGEPCPRPNKDDCPDLWTGKGVTETDRTELQDLMKKLVQKTYRRNLLKTVDYDVSFKGASAFQDNTVRVRTEAVPKDPRGATIQVDYILRPAGGSFQIVNLVIENASLTKNYYDQFNKMLMRDGLKMEDVKAKIRTNLAKPNK